MCNICSKRYRGVCYHVSGACFKCGKQGHMARDCNQKSGKLAASSTASILKPGNTMRSTTTGDTVRQGRVFALVPGDTRNASAVVSGTISICNQDAFVLIDSGSTHSFVTYAFVSRLSRPLELLPYLLCVSAPSGEFVLCESVYYFCNMRIGNAILYVDLLPLNFRHFDIILGMDWLTKYCATIDCVTKRVVFRPPAQKEIVFVGDGVVPPPYLISVMKACKLIRKGCQGYLYYVLSEQCVNVELNSIPIVREFPDVFPNELPGELVDREIEHTNEIEPDTHAISNTPYRMATAEMKELKEQLQDLLVKV